MRRNFAQFAEVNLTVEDERFEAKVRVRTRRDIQAKHQDRRQVSRQYREEREYA